MRKQLTLFEIWQNDRSRAVKLNERTPHYLMFYRRSSPSDVNSPCYLRINCWKLCIFSSKSSDNSRCRRLLQVRDGALYFLSFEGFLSGKERFKYQQIPIVE